MDPIFPTRLTPVHLDVTRFPNGKTAHYDEFYADEATIEQRCQELRDAGFTILQAEPRGFAGFKQGFNDATGREILILMEVASEATYGCGCPRVPPAN